MKISKFFSLKYSVIIFLVIASWLLAPLAALAHPLGNFSVNRYARLEVYANAVRVRYVVDMAEVPAFQEMPLIDTDRDGKVSDAENARYRETQIESIRRNLVVELNGTRMDLRALASELTFPPGQGNLRTMRLGVWFEAPLNVPINQATKLQLRDDNFADRLGWKEVVARGSAGVKLTQSSAPAQDETDELHKYPENMLENPLNRREALVTFEVINAASTAPALGSAAAQTTVRADDPFAQLIGVEELSVGVIIASLLGAMVWGALHAFSPGHGKTVVAAYLVGSRGTAKHALYLGLTVTATHTIGVYALGLITLFASQYILPEQLFPVLGVISGLMVLSIGATLFWNRLRGKEDPFHSHSHEDGHTHDHALAHADGHAHDHPHPHADGHAHDHPHDHPHEHALAPAQAQAMGQAQAHDHPHPHAHADGHTHEHPHPHDHAHDHAQAHDHPHPHDHDHTHDHPHPHAHDHGHSHDGIGHHTHMPPEKLDMRNLLMLGVSGGLIPCPSALVVMLAAIALQRVGFGLILIIAFSLGLAGVLTATGILMVYAGRLFNRLSMRNSYAAPIVRWAPVASALFMTIVGLLITIQALMQWGV